MFTWLRSLFSAACIVELSSQRISVRDLADGRHYEFTPVLALDASKRIVSIGAPVSSAAVETFEPFASPTALAKNARVAELLIQYAYARVGPSSWIKPAPRVVLYVPRDRANAVDSVEDSTLLALSTRAGAHRAVIHRAAYPTDEAASAMLDKA